MKLTKNFNKSEFDSRDGAEMPIQVLRNVKVLAKQLQKVRTMLAMPIHINSGYRSVEYNESIGGVLDSMHVQGKAADLTIEGLEPTIVYKILEVLINDGIILQGGLGLYNTFVHYDTRGKYIRWDYTS